MIRQKLLIFLSAIVLVTVFVLATPVSHAAFNPLQKACSQAPESPTCQDAKNKGKTNPIAGPDGIISKAANIVALVAVIGAVIMIIIGGFFYVTSAGNAESAKKAKDRIIAALIGIVIVALAWAIVRLITDRVLQ